MPGIPCSTKRSSRPLPSTHPQATPFTARELPGTHTSAHHRIKPLNTAPHWQHTPPQSAHLGEALTSLHLSAGSPNACTAPNHASLHITLPHHTKAHYTHLTTPRNQPRCPLMEGGTIQYTGAGCGVYTHQFRSRYQFCVICEFYVYEQRNTMSVICHLFTVSYVRHETPQSMVGGDQNGIKRSKMFFVEQP